MSKRGRKKKLKFNIKSETVKSVSAVFLILFGALCLWSLIAPSYKLTSVFYFYQKLLFGLGSYILPFALIFTGILMLWPINRRFLNLRITIGLYIIFILVASLAESFVKDTGGKLGFFVSNMLSTNIGYIGNLIVLILCFTASLIFLTDIPTPMIHAFLEKVALKKSSASEESDIEEDEDLKQLEDDILVEEESDYSGNIYKVGSPLIEPLEGNVVATTTATKSNEPKVKEVKKAPVWRPGNDGIWEYPALSLLDETDSTPVDSGDITQNKKTIVDVLKSFNVIAKVVSVIPGPSVTQYAVELQEVQKLGHIINLGPNLALALASPSGSVRIQAPIPGTSLIGIEVPNRNRVTVSIKQLLSSDKMKGSKEKLNTVIGLDVTGKPIVYNIAKMPHLLVAGATGTGKSVFLHTLLFSILFRNSPSECKLIIIDPKEVDFSRYEGIPHLITPIITDKKVIPNVFKWATSEMDRRFKLLRAANASNIDEYNEKSGFQAMPYIVILVEEFADIMLSENKAEIEKGIQSISQKARAAGIHLILATQRPSKSVLNTVIKANMPCKVAFTVNNKIDSQVILDQTGAEQLLGKGDMLFFPSDYPKPARVQAPYVSNSEMRNLIDYLKNQGIEPDYDTSVVELPATSLPDAVTNPDDRDEFYNIAKEYIISAQRASASLLQTRLSIGFNRATRLLQQLEDGGVVGPANGAKARSVLIKGNNDLAGAFADGLDDEEDNSDSFESNEEQKEN